MSAARNGRTTRELRQLAKLFDVQVAYNGVSKGGYHYASEESLRAIISDLGLDIRSSSADIGQAIEEKKRAVISRFVEPVTVAWDRQYPEFILKVPEKQAGGICRGALRTESGETEEFTWSVSQLPLAGREEVSGERYLFFKLALPKTLPHGYHRIVFDFSGLSHKCTIISAPSRTYSPPYTGDGRSWGVFLPLYALETEDTLGAGDYSALGALMDTVADWGGSFAGTLPLLPLFLDEPFEPSPYSPVTRLAWNEFYIDPRQAPDFASSDAARNYLFSAPVRNMLESLKQTDLVDYREVMKLKKDLVLRLCDCSSDSTADQLAEFARDSPGMDDYARFRAVMETRKGPWRSWPERIRNGDIRTGDYEQSAYRYYLYSQWLADRQIEELAARAGKKSSTLYFDLPLGVHRNGYDVWRYRDLFADESSAGAPPDAVFTAGQDWGFPPLHPERIREDGYRYVRQYLRHHLEHAGMLRIDHVMGLHRLFWIPRGLDAAHGVYVRYRADEFYAVLSIESNRAGSIIVGEDLGNVPRYVRRAMSRHGLHRMFIVAYELADNDGKGMYKVPREMIAGLNTHDMAPFAAFWNGEDIDKRAGLGLIKGREIDAEKKERRKDKRFLVALLRDRGYLVGKKEDVRSVLEACLKYLAAEDDLTLMVNLEDLWLENTPQNIPGTVEEHPNWRHKARCSLEEIRQQPLVLELLKEIDRLRRHDQPS